MPPLGVLSIVYSLFCFLYYSTIHQHSHPSIPLFKKTLYRYHLCYKTRYISPVISNKKIHLENTENLSVCSVFSDCFSAFFYF
jgi:hypothetical protein